MQKSEFGARSVKRTLITFAGQCYGGGGGAKRTKEQNPREGAPFETRI